MQLERIDERTISEFNAGKEEAFESIYKTFFISLAHFASRIIQNEADAKDIAAVTFEVLWKKHEERFSNIKDMRSYLFGAVKNKCMTYLADTKRQHHMQQEFSLFINRTDDYVLAQMVRSEFLHQVYQEIETLPNKRKMVFKLFYIEGLNSQEISKKLKMKPADVYNNKKKALDQLRNILFDKKLLPVIVFFWCIKQLCNYCSSRIF